MRENMFSENNRISGRQAFRLLTYDLLGLSTLLVPPALGRMAGRDGIFCIAAGVAAGFLFLKLLGVVARDMEEAYPAYLVRRLGRVFGTLAQAGYVVWFVTLAGYTAYLFTDAVKKNLLREESYLLVLLVIVLLAVYGLWGGIEGRARIYEMLFWFLIIPLFLMLIFALDEIRTDYWIPVATAEPSAFLKGSYQMFACMAMITFVVFAGSYVEDKRRLLLAGKRALLFTGAIHAALYLILLGIFGAAALGEMDYPAVTLMSAVRISGGFLKRADAFMFAVWFFTLYALLNSCVFYGSVLVAYLYPGEAAGSSADATDSRRMRIVSAALLGVVCLLACSLQKHPLWRERCEMFLWRIGTPFLVLVPLVLCGVIFVTGVRKDNGRHDAHASREKKSADREKKSADREKKCAGREGKRTAGMLAAALFCAGTLSGCGTAELEDRNFPIEIAVQGTEHVAAAWMNAGQEGNREIDYSHLKVILFAEEFIEDETAMQEFLAMLEETDEVPRNTYLVVAEDPAEFVGKTGAGSSEDGSGEPVFEESVGNYLEQLFENVSQIRRQAYPTLGMLYQERANRCETLLLPYISMEGDKPAVTQYFVWKRGEPAGVVDTQTALLSYFTGNEMEEYSLTLEDGTAVTLSGAHNQIHFEESGKGRRIVVKVRCAGKVHGASVGESEGVPSGDAAAGSAEREGMEELTRQVEQYMQQTAERLLTERQIDVSGSYRKLGGERRDWYAEYAAEPARYENGMEIVYQVQVDWE